MSKELPYFRFTGQEWLSGDITLEDYEYQGLFVNCCVYYWLSNCSLTLAKLKQRLKEDSSIDYLLELGVIKHDKRNDLISISFLNEQWESLSDTHSKRARAGAKGGKAKSSNAKARLKPASSYKDKDKDKDNIAKKPKPLKKHDFNQSPFFLKDDWFNALSDWPKNKALDYWERANEYSGSKGVKYANWVMAVKGWERRDNPKQPATSNQSHSTIMV